MATKNPEIHTDEIALFPRPPVNVAEDRISWHEVRPSYMGNADYSSINFSIIGNSSQYVKLSDTELYVRINRLLRKKMELLSLQLMIMVIHYQQEREKQEHL